MYTPSRGGFQTPYANSNVYVFPMNDPPPACGGVYKYVLLYSEERRALMGLVELLKGREDFLSVGVHYSEDGNAADIVLRIDGTYFKQIDPKAAALFGEWPLSTPEETAARWREQINAALVEDGLQPMTGRAL